MGPPGSDTSLLEDGRADGQARRQRKGGVGMQKRTMRASSLSRTFGDTHAAGTVHNRVARCPHQTTHAKGQPQARRLAVDQTARATNGPVLFLPSVGRERKREKKQDVNVALLKTEVRTGGGIGVLLGGSMRLKREKSTNTEYKRVRCFKMSVCSHLGKVVVPLGLRV